MPCTVVVLSDNNVIWASDTFRNVFRENFAARSSFILLWYSISSRLNVPPVRIFLETAPHPKLLGSDEILITASPFVILFLEQFILLYHHWTSVIDYGDKIIIASKYPLDILSAFVLYIYSELLHVLLLRLDAIKPITFATHLIVWLFLWSSSLQ